MNADSLVGLSSVRYDFVAQLTSGGFVTQHVFPCLDLGDLRSEIDLGIRQIIYRLTDDLKAFKVFQNTYNYSGKYITAWPYSHVKIKILIATVRRILADIYREV